MQYNLSFAQFTIHSDNILEMLVNDDTEVTLEMIAESDRFITEYFPNNFVLLINSINNYTYSYEAQLCIGSHENLTGIAFLYYSQSDLDVINQLKAKRKMDNWNSKTFSGLELGWQQAYAWSKNELSYLGINVS